MGKFRVTEVSMVEQGEDEIRVAVLGVVATKDEAREFLNAFLTGWNLSGKGSEADDKAPIAASAESSAPRGRPKRKPEPEPEPEEEDEEEEEEDDSDSEEEEEEDEEEAPSASKLKIAAEDLKVLKNAKKLRDVLDYLINKKGVKTKTGLVKACTALKDKVPALERIADLASRIPEAVSIFDPSVK